MLIGKLRYRITIQELSTENAGSFGVANASWTDVKTVYAQFQVDSSAESTENGQTVGSTQVMFRIREPKDYTPTEKMRISFKGKYYYITGIRPANAGDHTIITAVSKDNG